MSGWNWIRLSVLVICYYSHLLLWSASLSTRGLRDLVKYKFYHDYLENVIVSWHCQTKPFFMHFSENSKLESKEYWMESSFPKDIYLYYLWSWTKFSYSNSFYFSFLKAVIGNCLVNISCESLWISEETQRDLLITQT